jgi:invasion protein IalB
MNDQMRIWLRRGAFALGGFVLGGIVGWTMHGSSGPTVSRISFYKDWRLACPSDDDKKASCALATDVSDPKSGTRLAQVTMGVDATSKDNLDKHVLVVTVPLTVLIAPGVGVQVGTDAPTTAAYATCLPSGCIATVPVTDAMADKLQNAASIGLVVTAESGRSITLPVSVQGYKEATAAMNATDGKRRSWWKRLWS